MKTVLASSDIFEASSKLQAAATSLAKLSQGDALRDEDHENLRWCGVFLEEVDWKARTDAGIADPEQIREFLSSTYHFLQSSGEMNKDQSFDHMDLAAAFLHRLSTELLLRLTGNGVPLEKDRPISTSA